MPIGFHFDDIEESYFKNRDIYDINIIHKQTDHKITDDAIIKALECIANEKDVLCAGCEYKKYDGLACHRIGARNALALINRQKVEIERLQSQVNRLKQYDEERDIRLHARLTANARTEAIKVFAREHREIILAFCDDDDQISLKVCEYDANTNKLVKEMTEVDNG